ncbi:hypothetical protein [Methanobacterium alcaliphilum]|uniref:hypothetical protein n=1 Tax=Methanobacterium alcaliphilum TaxID=392018 RepID=UPI002009FA0D|nr:hypothetical protein [Methanobacterium alcaliphilum]MCK9150543.1 hypothetical protein [Methanobacterium alcaliphilum]
MNRMVFDKRVILVALTLLVFVFAVQMAEPAAAAKYKKFDSGTKVFYSSYWNTYYKYSWNSYKKPNYILVKDKTIWYDNNEKITGKYVLKKVNKKKLKIVDKYYSSRTKKVTTKVYYKKTKLTAYKYYKKHFNKKGKGGFGSVL